VSAQRSIADYADGVATEPTAEHLERLYQEHDGVISLVASHFDHIGPEALRQRLIDAGIHRPTDDGPTNLIKHRPEDVGLEPLNCGQCGAEEIDWHPCEECGFDPRNNDYGPQGGRS
jgi:hypothetical protein